MDTIQVYIDETRKVLGKEHIKTLSGLFEAQKGMPPSVPKKRYRADHIGQIDSLDYLEQSANLIQSDEKNEAYFIRPYALPLIDSPDIKPILERASEIYEKLRELYRVNLDTPVKKDQILTKKKIKDKLSIIALYYLSKSHDVHRGYGKDFPFNDEAHLYIDEDVLKRSSFLEVLTDYYRWHFLNKEQNQLAQTSLDQPFNTKDDLTNFFDDNDPNGFPIWFNHIGAAEKALVIEINSAMNSGLRALPAIGIRALIENIMVILLDDRGSFRKNLIALHENGHISEKEKTILEDVYDIGSAVMHRSYTPSQQTVKTCLEVIKQLMHKIYIVNPAIEKLNIEVPKRK